MSSILSRIDAEQQAGEAAQREINSLRYVAEIRTAIEAAADERHAAYPQYAGHWAGEEWQLGCVLRSVRTKMGVAFHTGDVVLYQNRELDPDLGNYVTAYSVRNGIDTALPAGSVEPLATETLLRPSGALLTFAL